jgi:hypothetical protein
VDRLIAGSNSETQLGRLDGPFSDADYRRLVEMTSVAGVGVNGLRWTLRRAVAESADLRAHMTTIVETVQVGLRDRPRLWTEVAFELPTALSHQGEFSGVARPLLGGVWRTLLGIDPELAYSFALELKSMADELIVAALSEPLADPDAQLVAVSGLFSILDGHLGEERVAQIAAPHIEALVALVRRGRQTKNATAVRALVWALGEEVLGSPSVEAADSAVVEAVPYLIWIRALPRSDAELPACACPACGRVGGLNGTYFASQGEDMGWRLVFCSSCRHGIRVSRCAVPPGQDVLRDAKDQARYLAAHTDLKLL